MKTLLPFWTKGKLVQFTDASRLRWRYILTFKNNELRLYMLEHFVLPPPPSDIIDPLEDIFYLAASQRSRDGVRLNNLSHDWQLRYKRAYILRLYL